MKNKRLKIRSAKDLKLTERSELFENKRPYDMFEETK
jgi:hypothetical protein